MLKDKDRNFIEKTASKLITDYEKTTGKKYKPNDLESTVGIVDFLGGEVVYLDNIYSKYGTDEILLSLKDGFLIIIDKEYREQQIENTETSINKIIFRMVWKYLEEYIKEDSNVNNTKVLYPLDKNISEKELLEMITKKIYNFYAVFNAAPYVIDYKTASSKEFQEKMKKNTKKFLKLMEEMDNERKEDIKKLSKNKDK